MQRVDISISTYYVVVFRELKLLQVQRVCFSGCVVISHAQTSEMRPLVSFILCFS